MKTKSALIIVIFFTLFLSSCQNKNQSKDVKSRLVIMADMGNEPDEMQQIMHLLMYNNEFDLEGLIAVTGKWLRPDFEGEPYRQVLHPELFDSLITGYARVYPNLLQNASGWHTAEYLKNIVTTGQIGYGIDAVGDGKSSPGSELITNAILKEDPRPVYIVVNAGANTLAQAIWDYRKSHSNSELDAFLSKIIIYDNGAQDDAGAWIAQQFPSLQYIRSTNQKNAYGGNTGVNEENVRKLGPWAWKPHEYSEAGSHAWAKENIQTNHGTLGNLYPDRIMENRFWFIEGGGTVPWIGLISRGLYDPYHPNWGGFSGRYTSEKVPDEWSIYPEVALREKSFGTFLTFADTSDSWRDPADSMLYNNINTPVHRWRESLFNDFKCRMDWCVENFEKANHNPVAAIDGNTEHLILIINSNPGKKLQFDASASFDPDKNQNLSFSWWIYPEAGSYKENIANSTLDKLIFVIPENAKGKQIHIILDVYDDSEIAVLHDYRRIVINVR